MVADDKIIKYISPNAKLSTIYRAIEFRVFCIRFRAHRLFYWLSNCVFVFLVFWVSYTHSTNRNLIDGVSNVLLFARAKGIFISKRNKKRRILLLDDKIVNNLRLKKIYQVLFIFFRFSSFSSTLFHFGWVCSVLCMREYHSIKDR